jgi:TolB-like protein/Flp pilus assembly protein TadD
VVHRRRRFLREARTAAAVNHPNIATIHEVGESGGVLFLAMELVEGKSLRARLHEGPMPVSEALRYARALADGLARAHEQGVVHRDLKPENVMLGRDDHPKILDFGLAKVLEPRKPESAGEDRPTQRPSQLETVTEKMTREGSIMGTVEYMSPEQARGEAVDARSDLFSFGSMLYEMVTGRRPFHGRTVWDTLAAVINQPAAPASSVNAAVPMELERVLDRCLQKAPEKRYATAQELVLALEGLEGAGETSAAVALVRALSRHAIGAMSLLIVAALALSFGLDLGGLRTRFLGGGALPPSIAVLPCTNAGGDPAEDYFADGLTEDIIGQVSTMASFDRVINPLSALRYKGTTKSPEEVAAELAVGHLLLCSTQREAGRVRVSVQLIDPFSEAVAWADSYVEDQENVLTIGADIAIQIATALEAEISPAERVALEKRAAVNPEAYSAYLKGRELQRLRTSLDFERSIRYFEQAIQHDASFARAHAEIGRSYASLPRTLERLGRMPWKEEWLPYREEMHRNAFDALESAEALDPDLAEIHQVRGLLFRWRGDFEEAEEELQQAIRLGPNEHHPRRVYAGLLSALNRHDEAIAEGEMAVKLDPALPTTHVSLGNTLQRARKYDRAMPVFEDALRLDPTWSTTYWYYMMALRNADRLEEAEEKARKFAELMGMNPEMWVNIIRATTGEVPAEVVMPMLLQLERIGGPYVVATFAAGMGEKEQAIALLQNAHAIGDPNLHTFIASEQMLDPLRSDPRFQAILEDLGLDDDLWGAG